MPEELISVIDVAKQTGQIKQTVFKILKRLGIATTKQHNSEHRNQAIAYITMEEFDQVREFINGQIPIEKVNNEDENTNFMIDHGVFYLIQLEPDHDVGRFKVGFASNMPERLRALRCSAPYAKIIKTWTCHRLWEKTAIDCVTTDCRKLHTEVFRTDTISRVQDKCEQFFSLMPAVVTANNKKA